MQYLYLMNRFCRLNFKIKAWWFRGSVMVFLNIQWKLFTALWGLRPAVTMSSNFSWNCINFTNLRFYDQVLVERLCQNFVAFLENLNFNKNVSSEIISIHCGYRSLPSGSPSSLLVLGPPLEWGLRGLRT